MASLFRRKTPAVFIGLVLLTVICWQVHRKFIDPRNENGMTPLMQAADRGDLSEVKRLAKKFSVNVRVPSNDLAAFIAFIQWMRDTPHHDVGWTALIYAARSGCAQCVQTLLDAGADINATGRDGSTALIQATHKNNGPLVDLLIAKGADAKNPMLLYAALGNNSHSLLKTFLAHGADPDAKVPGTTLHYSKMTPLLVSVHRRDTEAVRILLAAKAHPEPRDPLNNWSALRFAHRNGLKEIEQLLRQAGAKDDGAAEEKLLSALRNKNLSELRQALAAGADPNSNTDTGNPLICVAAERGDTEMVALLLEYKASVNTLNNYSASPLWLAISFRHPQTAALLVDSGAEIISAKNNPLAIAVQVGDMATTQLLLSRGANANIGNGSLLRAGAKNGDLAMVKLLIDHRVDPLAINESGENALHAAAYKAPPELITLLLEKGVNVNKQQQNGWTPLVNAASVGNLANVKLFLAAGADPNIKDRDGKSVLDHARHYPEIQQALRAAGAK